MTEVTLRELFTCSHKNKGFSPVKSVNRVTLSVGSSCSYCVTDTITKWAMKQCLMFHDTFQQLIHNKCNFSNKKCHNSKALLTENAEF